MRTQVDRLAGLHDPLAVVIRDSSVGGARGWSWCPRTHARSRPLGVFDSLGEVGMLSQFDRARCPFEVEDFRW